MHIALILHIAAGSLGLILGAIAISVKKGQKLHVSSGRLFVYAMLVMSLTGAFIAAVNGPPTSLVMGLFAAYMVVTAFTTVRPFSKWVDIGALVVAAAMGLVLIASGIESAVHGVMVSNGMPVPMMFVFGTIALSSAVSDIRFIRTGRHGVRRIARHLWRMCFALFIATGSFFLGQADEIPEPLRFTPLLVILALAPLLIMVYWLWRVRTRKTFREITGSVETRVS